MTTTGRVPIPRRRALERAMPAFEMRAAQDKQISEQVSSPGADESSVVAIRAEGIPFQRAVELSGFSISGKSGEQLSFCPLWAQDSVVGHLVISG